MMTILAKSAGMLFTYMSAIGILVDNAGSGFLFEYNGHHYIATARHCIDKYSSEDFCIKVSCQCTHNISQEQVTIVLKKKNFLFNFNDTDASSYDVALYNIDGFDKLFTEYKLSFIQFPAMNIIPKLSDGDSLFVVGFPQSQTNKDEIFSKTIPLHPFIVQGELLDTSKNSASILGFTKKALDRYTMKIENTDNMEGISGSIVFLHRENDYYPIGIISSGGTGRFGDEPIYFLAFAHIDKLYQMLNRI